MTKSLFSGILAISLSFISSQNTKASNSDSLTNPALAEVYKAIVRIEVISEKGSGGRMMKSRSTGSGVIITKMVLSSPIIMWQEKQHD